MRLRCRRLLRPRLGGVGTRTGAFLLASLAPSGTALALSSGGGCHGPRIVVGSTVSEPWRDAAEDVRARLTQEVNLDRCAELFLATDAERLHVRVSLADGRATERWIREPSALYQTLKALLSLPPAEPRAELAREDLPAVRAEAAGGRARAPQREPHLEVGLGAAGSLGGSPVYGGIGLTAFAQLDLGRWLVGVSSRWDASDALVSEAPPSGFNMQALALGVEIGVRSTFGAFTLDALVGPQVRIENQEAFGGETAPDGIGGGTSDVRLGAALRLATPRDSALRWFTEVELDASPARVAHQRRLDSELPTLPAWGSSLALGALWGLR